MKFEEFVFEEYYEFLNEHFHHVLMTSCEKCVKKKKKKERKKRLITVMLNV